MPYKYLAPIWIVIFFIFFSCKRNDESLSDANDPILVSYAGKQLKYSDVSGQVPAENNMDSLNILSNISENWVKDQIMIHEARKQIQDKERIEKLTEDFKSDLLLLAFEEQLIKQQLDTLISDDEIVSFYNSNKARYKLESTIFRFVFMKINKPIADPKNLDELWKNPQSRNLQLLNVYCQNNAEICFLNPERWYKWEEVNQYIPSGLLSENNIHASTNRDFADFNHAYKIRFFEVVKPNQEPPLSFLREQATQAILHKRKIALLDKTRADLYERELKNKKINYPTK